MSFPEEEQMAKMFQYAVSQGSQQGTQGGASDFTQTDSFQTSSPLSQRYQVIKEIGQGGMGKVYQVYDNILKRNLALKTILGSQNEQAQKRFLREAKAMAKLSHPNIIKVYDIGQNAETIFFTMDFIAGQDLSEKSKKEKIPIRRVLDIMIHVCRAIEYAHREGVLHRDLKPSNVMIDDKNKPYVMDFGLAKEREEKTKLSQTGAMMGTPAYMPPEQALGERRRINEKSDVYSLGATLYELLTGRPPFVAENNHAIMLKIIDDAPIPPSEVNRRVPKELDYICLKALEKEQKDRYRSAQQLATDLKNYLDEKPLIAKPISTTEAAWKWIKRNKKISAIIATSVLVVSLAIAGQLYTVTKNNYALTKKNAELDKKNIELDQQREALKLQTDILAKQTNDLASINKKLIKQGEALQKQTDLARVGYEEATAAVLRMLTEKGDYNEAEKTYHQAKKRLKEGIQRSVLSKELDLIFQHRIAPSSIPSEQYPPPKDYNLFACKKPSWTTLALHRRIKNGMNTVVLWNIKQQKIVDKIEHNHLVNCTSFHPEDRYFASGDEKGNIVIWQPQKRMKFSLQGSVICIEFHPVLPLVLCSSKEQAVLYSLKTEKIISKWHMERPQAAHNSFRPNHSEVVLTGKNRSSFLIQDIKNPNRTREIKNVDIQSLKFAHDGSKFAIGEVGQITLFYMVKKSIQRKVIVTESGKIKDVVWSYDGRFLASLGINRKVTVRDAASGRSLYTISDLDRSSFAIRFDKKNRLGVWSQKGFFLYSFEKSLQRVRKISDLKMANAADQKWVKQRSFGGLIGKAMLNTNSTFLTSAKSRIAISPNKRWLAFQIPFASVLYDLKNDQAWLVLKDDFQESLVQMFFTDDSKYLFLLRRKSLEIWDVEKGKQRWKQPFRATSIFYSSRLSLIGATESFVKSEVYQWNPKASQPLTKISDIREGYKIGQFYHDNKIIFSRDNLFSVWQFSPGKPKQILKDSLTAIRMVNKMCIYKPNEVALGSTSGELIFWNWKTKRLVDAPQDADAPVEGIVYNAKDNLFWIQRRNKTPMLTKTQKLHGLYPAPIMDGYSTLSSTISEDGKLLAMVIPGFKLLIFENP